MAFTDRLRDEGLRSLFGTAGQMGPQGTADISAVSNQLRTLVGGDRASIARYSAPAANAAVAQADASRREAGLKGRLRTGGSTAAQAAAGDQAQANIDTIISQTSTNALDKLANVSAEELQTYQNMLSKGTEIAQADVTQRNQAKAQLLGSIIGGVGSIVGGGLAGGQLQRMFGSLFGGGGNKGGGSYGPPQPMPPLPPITYQHALGASTFDPNHPFFNPQAGLP